MEQAKKKRAVDGMPCEKHMMTALHTVSEYLYASRGTLITFSHFSNAAKENEDALEREHPVP